MTERTRQGEELVKKARAERMPGLVVTDLSARVDDDMMNRLRGLEREAASYPKKREEPSNYAKGMAAGIEAMAMRNLQSQAPSQTVDVTFTEPERRSTAYVAPERSSNPLLSREPMGFNETYGVKGGVPMARDTRKREDAESLANFYTNLPTNPETGERDLGNFASKYLVSKGAIEPDTVMVVDPEVDQPRNSGGLLQGQLRGETLYNQQENREPFVQDQQIDAIYSGDEQGPGFKSGRGEAQRQMQNFMAQMLDDNAASNERIQKQVASRETPRFAPSPEMVGNYVKPEFRAVSEKPSVNERLRSAGIAMQGVPVDFGGEGIGLYGERGGRDFNYGSLSSEGAQRQLKEAGVSEKEASDYWMGKLKSKGILDTLAEDQIAEQEAKESSALVAPSMTISEEPTVKKTTIIEETVPATQQRMSPLEASEKLRRIQTSGRPNSRQEAQDFLQSIKGQMING